MSGHEECPRCRAGVCEIHRRSPAAGRSPVFAVAGVLLIAGVYVEYFTPIPSPERFSSSPPRSYQANV